MGKKYKNDGWMDSMTGKNADLEKRYGVDPVRFSRSDDPNWAEDVENRNNYTERMTEGFRKDYDARETLQAAANSGKKEAQEILDSGFKSVGDIRNAQNFFEKAAKRHGQGGQFSNASDYMGLTQSMVERDRRINNEQFVTNDEFNDYKKNLEDYKKNEAVNSATKDLKDRVLSDHMQEALDNVSKWEKGNPPVPIFPEGIRAQHQGNPVRQLTQDIDIANLTRPESFLENYKQEILDEYGFERVI